MVRRSPKPEYAARGKRIELSRLRRKWSQLELAEKVGVPNGQQTMSKIERGVMPGDIYAERLAEVLGVPREWLEFGTGAAPAWAEEKVRIVAGEPMTLAGIVRAGDGDLTDYIEPPPTPIPIPTSWTLVRVEGMSAYPVVFPTQMVIVDNDRAKAPAEMREADRVDLHDNIVVVQVQKDGEKIRAYLKRFCHAPGAAGDFMLASIDAGRSSPFVAPADIFLITPVVGVLYRDPTKPRVKMNHAITVVPQTEI